MKALVLPVRDSMEVEIYGAVNCGFCEAAKSLATDIECQYRYYDITEAPGEFSSLFPGAKTVPQIIVDGEWIGGYQDFVSYVAGLE